MPRFLACSSPTRILTTADTASTVIGRSVCENEDPAPIGLIGDVTAEVGPRHRGPRRRWPRRPKAALRWPAGNRIEDDRLLVGCSPPPKKPGPGETGSIRKRLVAIAAKETRNREHGDANARSIAWRAEQVAQPARGWSAPIAVRRDRRERQALVMLDDRLRRLCFWRCCAVGTRNGVSRISMNRHREHDRNEPWIVSRLPTGFGGTGCPRRI